MTEELEGVKQMIESTHKARILLERNDFLLVKWDNAPDRPVQFCLHAYPYGKTGMANQVPWREDITDEQAEYFLAHPDEAEEYFKSKHWYFHAAEIKVWSFDDITGVSEMRIDFKDGHWFGFAECVQLYKRDFPQSKNCVGQRDITANPPYIEFWSFYHHDKVVFDKRGVFSKNQNEKNFRELCRTIEKYGYSTFDLS